MRTPEQIVSTMFVIALFYGLYLATLFYCIRWLCFADEGWRIRKKINWPMFAITCVIFVLSTLSRGIEVLTYMQQVAPPKTTLGAGGTDSTVTWTVVVLCTDANVTTLLADGVLIYRCWMLWNKSIRIISLPLFLWIGGLGLTGLQAYVQIVQSAKLTKAWLPVDMSIGPGTILTPFWATTIVLNLYTTFTIIYRLRRFAKETDRDTSIHLLRFLTRVLVDSGFLYLTTGIAHFVVWWTPSDFAVAVVSGINLPTIGIAFNLILIRLAQNRAKEEEDSAIPVSILEFQHAQVKSDDLESSHDGVIEIRNPARVSSTGSITLRRDTESVEV